jgi:hypothetical protein
MTHSTDRIHDNDGKEQEKHSEAESALTDRTPEVRAKSLDRIVAGTHVSHGSRHGCSK